MKRLALPDFLLQISHKSKQDINQTAKTTNTRKNSLKCYIMYLKSVDDGSQPTLVLVS